MSNLVKRVAANTAGRDIIVGDVHGNFTGLRIALDEIAFDAMAGDRLFHVGDLVDRGSESAQVLDWLAQPFVHCVAGNHEAFAISWVAGDLDFGLYAANGGSWMMSLDRETQHEIAAAFSVLPIAIELDTAEGLIGIVHAECPLASWESFVAEIEAPSEVSPRKEALIQAAQWARTRISSMDNSITSGVRAVVVGHTPMGYMTSLGNTLFIDTMGWRPEGHFTLLDAASLEPAVRPMCSVTQCKDN